MNLTVVSNLERDVAIEIDVDEQLLCELNLNKENKANIHIDNANAVRVSFKEKHAKSKNILQILFGFIVNRIMEQSFEEELQEDGFWKESDVFIDALCCFF